jgi:hypothetical protein
MKRKNVIVTMLIMAVFSVGLMKLAKADVTPDIKIDPPSQQLPETAVGQTFNISITINNVADLWAWKVRLNWNPNVLNITSVQEGLFLRSLGNTLFLWPGTSSPAIIEGYVPEISCNLFTDAGASGNGTLATLTFKVLATGESDITINETALLSSTTGNPPIQHTDVNGYVTIVPEFPVLLVLLPFMILIAIALIGSKKLRKHTL